MTDLPGPLDGVRVLDLADEYGTYAARLLADLGADVLRIELGPARPVWPAPTTVVDGREISASDCFVNAGKTVVNVSELEPGDLAAVLTACDVLIAADGALDALGVDLDSLDAARPDLVRVSVSPFGSDVPTPAPVDDLIVLGAGGLLHLGGYRDLGPMGAWGGQSTIAASLFTAVAAIAGLLERERSGTGLAAEVSAQEAVAQALEDSVAQFALTGHARDRRGEQPREAGTGIYRCADGYVSMVAGRLGTAQAWAALVAWLIEAGAPGSDALAAEQWSDFHHRQQQEAVDEFGEIFERFAADFTMESLYREAERRSIALSPVNDMAGLMADRQLEERRFFVEVDDEALRARVAFPGAPYRLSATPARSPRSARRAGRAAIAAFVDGASHD